MESQGRRLRAVRERDRTVRRVLHGSLPLRHRVQAARAAKGVRGKRDKRGRTEGGSQQLRERTRSVGRS